mgnify:CR=1 FL=1
MTCCVHQHINSLFERASHEGTGVLSIDSMTSDSHQVTFCRHHIAKQSQMPIVYVETIELQHSVHFFLYRLSDGFNTQHTEDFANIVTECTHRVNITLTQHLHHRCSVRFKQPLTDSFELTRFGDDDAFFCISLRKLKRMKIKKLLNVCKD